MRAKSDLIKLHNAIRDRLRRLRVNYRSLPLREPECRRIIISNCVLELDNLLISSLREFTLSTLMRARTKTGHRISVNRKFGSEQEISAFILQSTNISLYNRMRPQVLSRDKEPTVRYPKDTEKILSGCAASNLGSLQRALALNSAVFHDIPTIRNFYAHRNEDTWRKVKNKARSLGLHGVGCAEDLVSGYLPGRPVTMMEDWLNESELFFDELTK